MMLFVCNSLKPMSKLCRALHTQLACDAVPEATETQLKAASVTIGSYGNSLASLAPGGGTITNGEKKQKNGPVDKEGLPESLFVSDKRDVNLDPCKYKG